ncbi:protein-export chaperone SecB [Myroides marinus]|uniref:protein-export chaperone SecB n=1 Tax=Myroides marinus TaxID=703342 RepID=UPI002576726E|nr:protein-export chaperone SecB [Myroides marinus]MDM1346522.1 protein-export chaperone SecB [Myroides marinus]MDM1352585.1 protein-export chaperone SecB [Myroides marinus]MDM1356105.1 protein-export chaperone SecB [Myroides marinus]MDM1359790.1 protein-export chaperone SecB [Myroides marinus]MDM1366869.1 protein-export chaperone SecB [Myroides marinus]
MENKPILQNKIKLERFFVENIKFNIVNDTSGIDISDELNIKLNVNAAFQEDNSNRYLIKLKLNLLSKDKNFSLKCKAIGVFSTSNPINNDFKESAFVTVNSPAIVFPFLRAYINTITTNSGISPLILPSINFTKNK